jgi:hypothetical protein
VSAGWWSSPRPWRGVSSRSPRRTPAVPRSASPKAWRSASVDTSPAPPPGNAGGLAHWPSAGHRRSARPWPGRRQSMHRSGPAGRGAPRSRCPPCRAVRAPARQEGIERLARCAGDQDAEHVGTRVVEPALTGLVHERHGAETADPLLERGRPRWRRWALTQPESRHRLQDGSGP